MAPLKVSFLLVLLALSTSVSAGRVLLQASCPETGSTCFTASGSSGYCCPSGFSCFSSDTFTCYPQGATYPSDASGAVTNGFTAGSTPSPTSPAPASGPASGPTPAGPSPAPTAGSAATGIPLSGGSCTSAAYPTTCTVADGSAQYCCPSGTGCFSSATFTCYDQGPVGGYPTTASNFDCSGVVELTIDEAQALFATGALTSRALVSCYLQRIADYDNIGTFKGLTAYPTNAILELNPDVLADADAKDAERASCAPKCGFNKLHGIPVLLKDNVCADGMECTAGSWNLVGSHHEQAYLVNGILAAGGIIIAKAGLSEWANYRGRSVSGWSGRGGQVADPYVRYSISPSLTVLNPYPGEVPSVYPDNTTFTNYLNPGIVSGSSSGSAVGAAMSLAMVTIGSETSGSILSPSGANGIVGIKPTVGLVSRAGVVPLSESQDTAGPMCRTVADAVYLLDTVTGVDPKDAYTSGQVVPAGGFAQFLQTTGLQGKKIAFLPLNPNTTDPVLLAGYNSVAAILESQGATVDRLPFPFTIPGTSGLGTGPILPTDFKVDINQFLSELTWQPGFTVQKTLADMIQFNKDNYLLEFQGGTCCRGQEAYANFFQQTWDQAQNTTGFGSPDYISAKMNASMIAVAITSFLGSNGYDAITSAGGLTGTFATAQFPSITIPGLKSSAGAPTGFIFHGSAYTESKLIQMGYAYEQAKPFPRPLPTFCNSASC